MRLANQESVQSATERKEFAKWILNIGDGNMKLNESGEGIIEIRKHLLIEHSESPLLSLVEFVNPKFLDNMSNANYFSSCRLTRTPS